MSKNLLSQIQHWKKKVKEFESKEGITSVKKNSECYPKKCYKWVVFERVLKSTMN